jgi:lysophospholipase L1-like esterase
MLGLSLRLVLSAAALTLALPLAAQTPTPAAPVQPVAPLHPAPPPTPAKPAPQLDWPNLARFHQADLDLAPATGNESRVVFMGDSITQGWHLDQSFPGKPYVNRGISGQTSPQMVLRFHQDVIALQPKVVILLAGTNDVAENTGPITAEETVNNIAAMAEMATANGIRVVLCSVLPAYDFGWRKGLEPAAKIVALNKLIRAYAEAHNYPYVDYYAAMKDDRGGLPETLSRDGVHPLPAGYAVMAPLAEAGIEQALKAKR